MPRRARICVGLLATLVLVVACGRSEPMVDPTPLAPNTLSPAEMQEGWKLLFDGRTTGGWHLYGKSGQSEGWEAIDGMLVNDGKGEDLVTDSQYDSFELSLEWKVVPGSNSGIFYWAHEASERIYHNAPEMQVLDNAGTAGIDGLHAAGALYDLYPAPLDAVKPAGEWNTALIITERGKVQQWLNGIKVVDVDFDSDKVKAKIAASKFNEWPTFGKTRRGYIGLQSHGDSVWYRNIAIKSARRRR
jgi:hypothetical protein